MRQLTRPEGLLCLFFPDLKAWERSGPEAVLQELGRTQPVRIAEVDRNFTWDSFGNNYDSVWVVAKQWEPAYRRLRSGMPKGVRFYFSIFDSQFESMSLTNLIFRRFRPNLNPQVSLLAHSAMARRFWAEMQGIEPGRIGFLPFGLPQPLSPVLNAEQPAAPTVGTYAPLVSESNLNYIINVAHYVLRRAENVRFRILGSGPLYKHLTLLIDELGLEDRVTVSDCASFDFIAGLDLFLYFPLRNDHFIPLLAAASLKIPVLATAVVGIEDYLTDGRDGYIVPVNETRPMGELILRLIGDSGLRQALGHRLHQTLGQRLGGATVSSLYQQHFWGKLGAELIQPAA